MAARLGRLEGFLLRLGVTFQRATGKVEASAWSLDGLKPTTAANPGMQSTQGGGAR